MDSGFTMTRGRILYVEPDSLARNAFRRFTPRHNVIADVVNTTAEAFLAARQHNYLAFVVKFEKVIFETRASWIECWLVLMWSATVPAGPASAPTRLPVKDSIWSPVWS